MNNLKLEQPLSARIALLLGLVVFSLWKMYLASIRFYSDLSIDLYDFANWVLFAFLYVCLGAVGVHVNFLYLELNKQIVVRRWGIKRSIKYEDVSHYAKRKDAYVLFLRSGRRVFLEIPSGATRNGENSQEVFERVGEILEAHLGPPVPCRSQRRWQRFKGWFSVRSKGE